MDGHQHAAEPINGGSRNQSMAPVISTQGWMLTLLLVAIPIVNIIMLFVWAFGGGANPSKANYAKASLLWLLIGIVLYVIFFVILFGAASPSTR